MPWQAELPLLGEKPLSDEETLRTIALGDRIVPYVLRRMRRKTIGLSIDERGLRVGAPRRTSLAEVESLILRHHAWVADKLDEWRSRRRPQRTKIEDGARLPLLGGALELRLALGNNRALWNEHDGARLTLFLRSPTDAGKLLERALRAKALALFRERLTHFAGRLGVAAPPLALSSARTRWGSCNSQSGIRLNWRLVHFPQRVVDYVVVHELAHLREMNHGKRFWALVETIFPDYRELRAELKEEAAHCPSW
jgi:predicted metal-dependent hydrolase